MLLADSDGSVQDRCSSIERNITRNIETISLSPEKVQCVQNFFAELTSPHDKLTLAAAQSGKRDLFKHCYDFHESTCSRLTATVAYVVNTHTEEVMCT